jgi:hypothetical protein
MADNIKNYMDQIVRLVCLAVILVTALGSAQNRVDDATSELIWDDFEPRFVPAFIYDISGKYVCTNEHFYANPEGNVSMWQQESGDVWIFNQHGSLLLVTIEQENGSTHHLVGSTVSDRVTLFYSGQESTQKTYCGFIPGRYLDSENMKMKDEGAIIFNALGRVYNEDDKTTDNWAGTGTLMRVL